MTSLILISKSAEIVLTAGIGATSAIHKSFATFCADEEGAATVDMVVLMGAGMVLGIGAMDAVSGGIQNLSTTISEFLSNIEIVTSFDPPKEVAP